METTWWPGGAIESSYTVGICTSISGARGSRPAWASCQAARNASADGQIFTCARYRGSNPGPR